MKRHPINLGSPDKNLAVTPIYRVKAVRNLWSRLRVCSDCGRKESVRKDNDSATCRSCAARKTATSANAKRREQRPPPIIRGPRPSRRVDRQCKECFANFSVFQSVLSGRTNAAGNFCSRPCYNKWLCRTDHIPYRGSRWPAVRREAIEINPFCALCGTGSRLQVHHVIPFRLTADNGHDNLIPLCVIHHRAVETIFVELEREFFPGDGSLAKIALMAQLRECQDTSRMKRLEVSRAAYY